MASINKVLILGRLGQDPSSRFTPNGDCVCNFSIATSETWKDRQTGEKKETTTWHNIVAWRQLGELCGKYLAKGSQCFVEGKLQTRSYEKDGVKRTVTEIVANDVQFLGGKTERQEPARYPDPPAPSVSDTDEIPF
jgi:single-strand DNA-binding protein